MLLNISVYIVFAFLLIDCALLLLVVLMQRPKQEGLGAAFGSQMTDQVFGAQTTDVLKKATVLFGSLFMILCFTLGVLINAQHAKSETRLTGKEKVEEAVAPESTVPAAQSTVPAAPAPAESTVPAAPAAETPAAPAAPAAAETPAEPAAPAAPAAETPAEPAAPVAPAAEVPAA
ncbi:MAG TPA: preprotein translocase subunit SecG [Candidatus Akkermansia intestinavium]|nr:preprotein translocase subunit SecG [Candidatus Akkermansia intestinavium]